VDGSCKPGGCTSHQLACPPCTRLYPHQILEIVLFWELRQGGAWMPTWEDRPFLKDTHAAGRGVASACSHLPPLFAAAARWYTWLASAPVLCLADKAVRAGQGRRRGGGGGGHVDGGVQAAVPHHPPVVGAGRLNFALVAPKVNLPPTAAPSLLLRRHRAGEGGNVCVRHEGQVTGWLQPGRPLLSLELLPSSQ
jgi:hypothetical protein